MGSGSGGGGRSGSSSGCGSCSGSGTCSGSGVDNRGLGSASGVCGSSSRGSGGGAVTNAVVEVEHAAVTDAVAVVEPAAGEFVLCSQRLWHHGAAVTALRFSLDQVRLYSGDAKGSVVSWSVK